MERVENSFLFFLSLNGRELIG